MKYNKKISNHNTINKKSIAINNNKMIIIL